MLDFEIAREVIRFDFVVFDCSGSDGVVSQVDIFDGVTLDGVGDDGLGCNKQFSVGGEKHSA